MTMSKCRICGCMCDPGDLQSGVCDDCREEEARKEEYRRMQEIHLSEQTDGQIVWNEVFGR